MTQELDPIVLTRDRPEYGLKKGDVGAVVHCYADGATMDVEFVTGGGKTVAVLTLSRADVRPLQSAEILHARELASGQSAGTLTASLVRPREVFKPALLRGAASVIVVHNHPSGDPTPSTEDLELTRQLPKAAELLDLRLHDHVIIGNGTGRWVSLAQQGIL